MKSPPVRDRARACWTPPWITWAPATAGAVTSTLASAKAIPFTSRTRMVWRPGAVPSGMVTTMRKRPEASATVVPSWTGSLRSSAASGLLAGNPLPVTVTLSPAAAWARSVLIVGPGAVVDVVGGGVELLCCGGTVTAVDVVEVGARVVVVEVEVEEVVEVGALVDVVDDDVVEVAGVDVEVEVEVDPGTVVDVEDVEVDDEVVELDVEDVVDEDVDELVVPVGTDVEVDDVLVVLDVVDVEVDVDVGGRVDVVLDVEVVDVLVVLVVLVEVVEVVEVVDVVEVVVPVMVTALNWLHGRVAGVLLPSPGYWTVQRYVPGAVGTKSLEVATPSALTALVDENTSAVQPASLKRRKVTLPVGAGTPVSVTESRTAVPTGPPGDGVAIRLVDRGEMTMVKVWHTGAWTPLVAQTVVGP